DFHVTGVQTCALPILAEAVELAPSTTHRLLQALQSQGFITQDNELGVWKIDVKTFRIGNSFLEARDFVATSRPFLRRLTAETGRSEERRVGKSVGLRV